MSPEDPTAPASTTTASTTETTSQDDYPFDAIPDEIIRRGLETWGLGDGTDNPEAETVPAAGDESPPEEEGEELEATPPPSPPGGPLWKEEPDETAPTGTPDVPAPPTPTADPVETLLARVATDPSLRDRLVSLLGQGQAGPAPLAPQPQQSPFANANLPQFSEDDLENPALRAMLLIVNEQQKQLQSFQASQTELRQQVEQRQMLEFSQIANSAASNFQSQYNIPEDLMVRVRDVAGSQNAIAAYMSGTDPRSGRPLTGQPDPYKAVEAGLEIAYWSLAEARQFEHERQTSAREAARSRKQKLAGVGGSSGSAPRTTPPPDTSTPQGRIDAAVAEVAAHMLGNEQ